MMDHAARELEQLRDRALKLLEQEKRAMHTGELATRLGALTHQIHGALYHAVQRGLVWFASSEGYSLPPADRAGAPSDRQLGINDAREGG